MRQRTPIWFAARTNVVTASRLGQVLGFCEVSAQQTLCLKKADHQRTVACFQHLIHCQSHSEPTIAMQWGTVHEANCQALLLMHHTSISHLGAYSHVQLQERGLCLIDAAALPQEVIRECELASLPKLGASPDGLLVCFDEA
jgi:hypothetical protein